MERALVVLIRGTTVLAGLLFIATDVVDVLGLIPYSGAMPPVGRRIAQSLPTLAAAIVLLLPYRHFLAGVRFRVLLAALLVLMLVVLGLAVSGVYGYVIGRKSWHIVPAMVLFFLIPATNAWALVRMRRLAGT